MEPQGALTRAQAHERLTSAAHALRASRPGLSLADAFELARLRRPDSSALLERDLDGRAGRGPTADRANGSRLADELGAQVRAHVRAEDGRVDPARLRSLAEANGCWLARYGTMSAGSRMAGVLARLRLRAERGHEIVFP